MRLSLFVLLIPVSLQIAVPHSRQAGPSVITSNGTVVGATSNGIDSFKGIPYAQPPVGARRLRPPVPLATSFGTIATTKDGPHCPPNSGASEDCLYLNVQRPAGTQAGRNLPVVAYIYGGSFESGYTDPFDATQIITQAVGYLNEPFIWVVFNYRLSAWGFLGGAELSNEGSTNLGLRDQRLALQWIQDNIRAFGGDPAKVTIWGESAGSFSVLDHLIINNGNNQYKGGSLFRAAILSSGTSLPTFPVRHPRPQATFNKLVQSAGCASAADKLQCLRGLTLNQFASAQAAAADPNDYTLVKYPPRPDPASSFFSTSPEKAIAAGAFVKVPIIVGTQEDEGTIFAVNYPQYAGSTSRIVDILTQQMPELSRTDATSYVNTYPATYPDRVTAGSPFRTGLNHERFTGYKRLSAIVGDFIFTLSRRITLDSMASLVPMWSSLATYQYETNGDFGTQHSKDTAIVLLENPQVPVYSQKKSRYISFWSYADPNYLGLNGNGVAKGDPNYGQWPRYSTSTRQLVNFTNSGGGAVLLTDDFRQSSYLEMNRNISRFTS